MDLNAIVEELRAERDQIDNAISAIEDLDSAVLPTPKRGSRHKARRKTKPRQLSSAKKHRSKALKKPRTMRKKAKRATKATASPTQKPPALKQAQA